MMPKTIRKSPADDSSTPNQSMLFPSVPFLSSTVICGQILARCSDVPSAVLAGLVDGTSVMAFAGVDPDGCWRPDGVPIGVDGSGRLDGTAHFVLDGIAATHLVTAAIASPRPAPW